MQSVFITGTDTGIGKTTVTAALLAAARRAGIDAVPMKPVQTGCARRGRLVTAPDPEWCLAAAGLTVTPREMAAICPYRFLPACSPHLAARLALASIRLPRILAALRALRRRHATVIVEGAGGVLVPLGLRLQTVDLIRATGLPVVLVARAGLGTLNHTLLSLEALRSRDIPVAGVVLVQTGAEEGHPAIADDNRRTIIRLGRVRVLAEFPFRPDACASPVATATAFAAPATRLLAALR